MKIRIINPAAELPLEATERMKQYLREYVAHDTELEFVQIKKGFRSVETEAQGIINGAQVLELVMEAQESDCDGIFINCFDDPAVTGARELSRKPAVGPYETSVLFGLSLGEKIAIITTDEYGMICEERKAVSHGFSSRIAAVKKVDLTVLELSQGDLIQKLLRECNELEKEGIHSAVLGCTGMNFVAEEVRRRLKEEKCSVQLIEPLKTGVTYLEYMIRMGYTNTIHSTKISLEDYVR